MNIIKDELLNSLLKLVILRFGGFYLEMSFVGGIGYLMEGLGIIELFEIVYVLNVVIYMISGKVIVWVVRVYFLIDIVFMLIILLYIYGILFLDEIENEIGINDINLVNYINIDNIDINVEDFLDELYEVDVMLDELLKGDIFVEKVCDNVLID